VPDRDVTTGHQQKLILVYNLSNRAVNVLSVLEAHSPIASLVKCNVTRRMYVRPSASAKLLVFNCRMSMMCWVGSGKNLRGLVWVEFQKLDPRPVTDFRPSGSAPL